MAGEFIEVYDDTYTSKEVAFCEAYLTKANAAWAYRQAGYSYAAAYSNAHTLLKSPKIKKYLAKRREELGGHNIITLEELLEMLTRIVTAGGAEALFTLPEPEEEEVERLADGREAVGQRRGTRRPILDLNNLFSSGDADLVREVSFDHNGNPTVKFYSKTDALRLLAQYYGINNLSTPEAENLLSQRGFLRKKEGE